MTADNGTLTTILEQFIEVFKLGRKDVALGAWNLLTALSTMELIIASLWWALTGQDALVGLIKKILGIGFFIFVVQNYDILLKQVIEGFIQTGKLASSNGGDALASVRDPSTIVSAGFYVALPIFDHLKSFGEWDVLFHIHDIIISGLCGIFILGAYFIIAIQVFVTYLEFSIVSTLGLILIPFGVFKHTRFLAEKAFGSIIAFGVKLMVLSLLVSVTVPVLKTFTVPEDPTWAQLFNLVLICLAVTGLAWHAPGVAAGMLSGGPSLTATTAAGTSIATAATGVGAALGAQSVMHPPVSSAAQATKSAASAIPIAHAGFQVAKADSMLSGSSGLSTQLRGVQGGLSAVGKAAYSSISSPITNLREGFSRYYQSRMDTVPGYEAYRSSKDATLMESSVSFASATPKESSGSASSPPLTAPEDKKDVSKSEDRASRNENSETDEAPSKQQNKISPASKASIALHLAKQSVPHPASPSAGINAPIRDESKEEL